MTDTSLQPPPKLNLLALPSLPAYYLGLMAAVMIGALLATATPVSPLRVGPFLLGFFLLLVVRDFLIQPEREAHRHSLLRPQTEQFPRLQQTIARLAQQSGLRRAPQFRLAQTPGAFFALGTFRHGYIAIASNLAEALEADLSLGGASRRRAEAALLHEIQHLSQRDIVFVGLARSLLSVGTAFCIGGLLLGMGIAMVSYAFPIAPLLEPAFAARVEELQPGLGQLWPHLIPPSLAEAAAQPPTLGLALLYLLNGFLPLIVTVGLMYWLIWPRLLRVRELYADAGVALSQGGDQAMWEALSYYGARTQLARRAEGRPQRLWPQPSFNLGMLASRWLGLHPSAQERQHCLEKPAIAFGGAHRNGALAGLLSVLLDLLLVGAFSAFYAVQVPGAIPVIVGVVAASLTLLPNALENQTGGATAIRSAAWIVGWVVFCRMGWHLLNLILLWVGVLLAPGLTSEILSGFVHNIAGALAPVAEGIVQPAELVSLAIKSTVFWLYLTGLLIITLSATIALEWRLRRMALTWYSLPGGARSLKWVLIFITLWTLLLVAGVVLPLVALFTPASPTPPYSLLGWLVIGLNGCLVVVGAMLFGLAHWRYARHCPKCRANVPGGFGLGRQCPACEERLWPDLIASARPQ